MGIGGMRRRRTKARLRRLLYGVLFCSVQASALFLSACAKEEKVSVGEEITQGNERRNTDKGDFGKGMSEGGGNSGKAAGKYDFSSEEFFIPSIDKEDFPKIDGSTATLPISKAIYMLSAGASEEEADEEITHGKTTAAYGSLMNDYEGHAELVIAYEPPESLKEVLSEEGIRIKPVGRDALVFMANRSNPVESLTDEEIRGIYSGKIKNWSEVGGNDAEIEAFQRPENSGSQNLMEKLVMRGLPMAQAPAYKVAGEMGELIDEVASYENTGEALGYSVYYYASIMYEKPELKFLAADGILPSNDTIRDGSYPYVSDFYVAIRGDEPEGSPAVQLFDWLTQDFGQALINELGYVGISDIRGEIPLYEKDAQPGGGENEAEKTEGFARGSFMTEVYKSVPIPEGYVIIADGEYFSGEKSTLILDKNFDIIYEIPHTECPAAGIFDVTEENAAVVLKEPENGKYGIFSLENKEWAAEPEYEHIEKTENGFAAYDSRYDETGKTYVDSYRLFDEKGALTEGADSAKAKELLNSGAGADIWERAYNFYEYYPEIMLKYNADKEAVQVIENSVSEPYVMIVTGEAGHIYRWDGSFLLDYDLKGRTDSERYYRSIWEASDDMVVIEDLSFGTGSGDANSTERSDTTEREDRIVIYRGKEPAKEIELEENEWAAFFEEDFFVIAKGLYRYVYDYDKELCAKFLTGYYKND